MSKNLGLKIGTPEHKLWDDMLKRAQDTIRQAKAEILINERIIVLCNEQINQEKEKLK